MARDSLNPASFNNTSGPAREKGPTSVRSAARDLFSLVISRPTSKRYTQSGSLQKYLRTHTGERPNQCVLPIKSEPHVDSESDSTDLFTKSESESDVSDKEAESEEVVMLGMMTL